MCGLCGVFGFIGPKEKDALSYLQIFSQLRGTDSTGVALVPEKADKEHEILKSIGGLETLVFSDEAKGKFNLRDWTLTPIGLQMVMSHHRKATIGQITDEKAHPFEYDKIIGCHNGTIWKTDLNRLAAHNNSLIDSEILLKEINDVGVVKAVSQVPTCGAWALVWWDKAERVLNFVRNDKRTLYTAYTEDQRTLFWASEPWMLFSALRRAGIKFSDKVFNVPTDKHYELYMEKTKVVVGKTQKVEGRTLFSQPPAVGQGQAANRGQHQRMGYQGPKSTPSQPRPEGAKTPARGEGNSNKFEENYVNTFLGCFTHRRRYLKLVESGCSNCTKTITWADRKDIDWLDEETPVCKACKPQFQKLIDENKAAQQTRRLQ